MNDEFPKFDGDWIQVDRHCVDSTIAQIAHAAPHLIPIYRAVRDHGIVLAELERDEILASIPKKLRKRPLLLFIADDLATAEGPQAFHKESLRKAFDLADLVAIHASGPKEGHYQTFAANAVAGSNVVVVETQADRLGEWRALHKRYAPDTGLYLIVPPPGARGRSGS